MKEQGLQHNLDIHSCIKLRSSCPFVCVKKREVLWQRQIVYTKDMDTG